MAHALGRKADPKVEEVMNTPNPGMLMNQGYLIAGS